MKRNWNKLVALLLALTMALALAACGDGGEKDNPNSNPSSPAGPGTNQNDPGTPSNPSNDGTDWSSFTDWMNESWDGKTVRYQFTGSWELAEYNYFYSLLINLYDDGSVLVDQRNTADATGYQQFGYWSEKNTADGKEISLDTLYCTNVSGNGLVAHEYHYDLYEESDGGYSFGYTFGISPGSFFREADMTGSATVTYANLDVFHEAVDNIYELYRFVNTEDVNGFSAVISIKSDNSAVAYLRTQYGDSVVDAHEDAGAMTTDFDTMTRTLVFGDVQIPLATNDDGSFANFPWTAVWDSMDVNVTFNMTQTDAVNEPAA